MTSIPSGKLVPESRTKVFRGLQALRAIAAIMVLCTHSGFYAAERLAPGYRYWPGGATGVDLFFVLSGFVMIHSSRSLLTSPGGWAIFAERRLVRIVPLYWIATTLKLAFMLAGAAEVLHAQAGPWQIFSTYVFFPAHNADLEYRPLLGVGWTLNFEMFFYFLFTLCLAMRASVYWVLGIIFTGLAVASHWQVFSGPPYMFYTDAIVLDFLYGMLIARFLQKREKPLNPFLTAGLAALGFVSLTSPVFMHTQLMLGLSAALILWAVVEMEPFLTRMPKWILFLGDASYAVYLFHSMVAPLAPALLRRLNHPIVWLSVTMSVALGIGAGCVVHSLVELPVTKFLRSRMRFQGRKIIHLPDHLSDPSAAGEVLAVAPER
ncbi:acyltransferase family protein [Silvibacterium acidisoli]|uniref:acyltransferase family protein n=1 Tax=Acidobacteriaceae bacterium ZG23-2 TaxID=2883246 RepID=UPI00406CC2AB